MSFQQYNRPINNKKEIDMKWFKKKKIQLTGMTWNDITVEQFQKIQGLDLKEMDGQIEAASILLGINSDDMTWAEFCKELRKLDFLNEPMPNTIVRKSYVLNGRKYRCLPNLQEMSVARYMDFSRLGPTGDLVKILAVFLIPEGKEYGDDLDQVYEDIKTMNIVEAKGIFNFFLLEFRVCTTVMKDFSVKALRGNKELQGLVLELMESYSMSDL